MTITGLPYEGGGIALQVRAPQTLLGSHLQGTEQCEGPTLGKRENADNHQV